MRKKTELHTLSSLALESLTSTQPVRWENNLGEVFIYEAGELTSYTDTRVIHELDDGLVNLMEDPLIFDDADLPEMSYDNR